jgi:two-component system phosphate regulon sensor histidine kinase PhoR
MRKSQNMRSDFIANASHELRTPLVSLKGFLETITDSAKDDPKSQQKFLEIMKSEANKMEVLIEELMALSRIELQEHIRPKDKVDIKEMLENVILLNSKKIKEKNIRVALEINDKERYVIGDREKLSAVFLNLLDNAIKYSGSSKTIKIKNTEDKNNLINYAAISVIDEGFGIAPQDIPRITERFFRTDNVKKLKIDGTGLGLAITKHIINQHKGELKILSKEGKGSEFIVLLPLFN